MKIELRQSGKSRNVDPRTPRILRRIFDRQLVISCVGVPVENDVIPYPRDIKRPVHLGTGVARHRAENLPSKKLVQEIASSKLVTITNSLASNHGGAREPKLQEGHRFHAYLLAIYKWAGNVGMPRKSADKLVETNRSKNSKNGR